MLLSNRPVCAKVGHVDPIINVIGLVSRWWQLGTHALTGFFERRNTENLGKLIYFTSYINLFGQSIQLTLLLMPTYQCPKTTF